MKIAFIASEANPYFKSGGLADVARSLPDALVRNGHDVRILHPMYGFVASRFKDVRFETEFEVPWTSGSRNARFYLHTMEARATAVLIEQFTFFEVAEPYAATVDPLAVGERFAFFTRAALHYARWWGADVVHVNDWQSALAPLYAQVDDIDLPTVLSIHNLAYQGNFPPAILDRIGVPRDYFRTENGLEFYGHASFLKAGLSLADRLTTVSPTYAEEIQTPAYGAGFDGLLRFRRRTLHGILNGIDVDTWNPATDTAIARPYTARNIEGKEESRAALLKELGLDSEGPLVVTVSRLAHQKGIDILIAALPHLIEMGASVAVLGDGDFEMEQAFARAQAQFPGRVAALFRFDDALSRRFYAGGDFFVMPSRYEPCGLGQMIAQRYGTVPIVRKTGGLVDTVENNRTGFLFDDPEPASLVKAARRAFAAYHRSTFPTMRRRCMRLDRSWGRSAAQYETVYRFAIGPDLG